MNEIIPVKKKLDRKKFFASLGVGLLGVTIFNSFPFSLFKSNSTSKNKFDVKNGKIKVQLNPLAVNRTKIGDRNA